MKNTWSNAREVSVGRTLSPSALTPKPLLCFHSDQLNGRRRYEGVTWPAGPLLSREALKWLGMEANQTFTSFTTSTLPCT